MRICIFASGSSGNCMLLSSGDTNILIDAGISMRRIDNALRQAGLAMRDVGGVLITHEHSDHISGLKMLIKHYAVPVYAPRTVAARLRGMLPEVDGCLRIIEPGRDTAIGTMKVRAFHTPHDTDESVGYRVEAGGVFALATDMGCVTEEIEENLRGADTVLIEANHDIDMLCYGPYPVYLKRRILSDRGHLSNEDCARLVRTLAENGVNRVILGHLSRENNTPEKALAAVRTALGERRIELCCAPPLGFLSFSVGQNAAAAGSRIYAG